MHQMDQRNRKTSSNQKRSLRARIKALVSEDKDFVSTPKLHRTFSIHRLESNEWVNPISFFSENGSESSVSSKTHPEVNDSRDILDMFEVDKELFINTLQDRSQASVIKPKLIKSGSFPTAYRSLMPLKLKDKMNETYTVSRSGKIKNSNEDVNSKNVIRLRRISSLDESAERYAQLFDFSFSKEAALRSSRSLKLTDGSESVLRTQQPSSFRPNNPNQVSIDVYSLRSSSQNERNLVLLPSSNDKYAELNSTQDFDSLNVVIDKDSHGLEIKEDNDQISQEIIQQMPVLVPEYRQPDENVHISEGNIYTHTHIHTHMSIYTNTHIYVCGLEVQRR